MWYFISLWTIGHSPVYVFKYERISAIFNHIWAGASMPSSEQKRSGTQVALPRPVERALHRIQRLAMDNKNHCE